MRKPRHLFLGIAIGIFAAIGVAEAQECGPPHKKHNCFCPPEPPSAPVLGSAPALMSPIVFTPPQNPAYQSSLTTLKELKELNELMAEMRRPVKSADKPAADAPLRTPSPDGSQDCCDDLEARMNKMDSQIKSLQESVTKVENVVLKALNTIDQRLQAIEKK